MRVGVGSLVQILHRATILPNCKRLRLLQKHFRNLANVCNRANLELAKFARSCKSLAQFCNVPTLQENVFARSCKSSDFVGHCKQSYKNVQPNLLAKDFACQHPVHHVRMSAQEDVSFTKNSYNHQKF